MEKAPLFDLTIPQLVSLFAPREQERKIPPLQDNA
jgi:hypothetical protein